jgi:hypothetical protein
LKKGRKEKMGHKKMEILYHRDGRRQLVSTYVPGPGVAECGSQEHIRWLNDSEPNPVTGERYIKPAPPPAPRSTDPSKLLKLPNLTLAEADILKKAVDEALRQKAIEDYGR